MTPVADPPSGRQTSGDSWFATNRAEEPLEGLSVQAELSQATQRVIDLAADLTDLHRRRGAVPPEQVMRVRADAATAAEAFKIAVHRLWEWESVLAP